MELGPLFGVFLATLHPYRRSVMPNPDVTQGEEVSAWQWIAGLAIIVVLLGASYLSERNTQVVGNEAALVPPISYPMLAP
jgi:hypothetical protein